MFWIFQISGGDLSSLEKITAGLNPEQKRAVEKVDGPVLILAGAGSGKTRVLTHRMARIIAAGAAMPEEILCVTFTNKASKEMEQRIYKILSDFNIPVFSQLWINTFHSFCVRILRQHITLLGYKNFFGIYDSSDQLSQIKKVMEVLSINDKIYPAKNFQSRISRAKMLGLSPQQLSLSSGRSLMDAKTLEVYRQYEIEMKKANSLDFDDLLLKTYELFRDHPQVLSAYQQRFKYIMVDEYQDTNRIQYLLVQMLAASHHNLCVVGDEDQSIYSWRGADIQNILSFEKDFPEATTVKLEENYRSTASIIKAATSVIQNNTQRKDKTLFTSNPTGELVQVQEEYTEYDEARFVANTIRNMINHGDASSYNDYAVFYRTNAQSRVLEEQLRTLGIPYRIVGGMRFYERMEIKDMLSYLKLALNPADDIACKRVINTPTRGIGKTTVEKIDELAFQQQLTFYQALQKAIETKLLNAGTTGKLRRFFDLAEELRGLCQQHTLQDFYHIVLDRTGYLTALNADESPEAKSRIENLEEFDNAIEQFVQERGAEASLQGFLEEMALISDIDSLDEQVNSVTLMTLHISKGLEFPYVFIVGMEENLFPSHRGDTNIEEDMEEERRLAYVGMTRARQKLWLTYTRLRRIWGQETMNQPSRFLNEISPDCIEFKSATRAQTSFVRKYAATPKPSLDFDTQAFPDYDETPKSGEDYSKGMRVRHPTFGVGSIFALEGSGEQLKVSVLFADQTLKKFVVKYARLEKI